MALNVANSTPPPVPGLLAIDATKSVDGRGTVTTPALGATQTGDLLLAFVSSDGPSGAQTATVSRRRAGLVARAPREHPPGHLGDLEGDRAGLGRRDDRHVHASRAAAMTSR